MMASRQFPDASAEVERLRVELEQVRAALDNKGVLEMFNDLRAETARADRLQAERDDLAARLQAIQQAEREYIAAKGARHD